MARSGKSGLRRWEFPAGSGIRVQEIINRYVGKDHGVSYRVTIPARFSGVRLMRQFPSMDAAEAWATSQNREITENGRRHFALTPQQRDDALEALKILDGTGLTLANAAKTARSAYHPPAGGQTVSVAISNLLAEKGGQNLRARSVQDLKNRLKVFEQTFGRRLLGEVTRSHIEQWLKDLISTEGQNPEPLSARTKKNYLVTVRTLFNWAASKGHFTSENPAAKIGTPKIDWKTPSILTVEESKRLIEAACLKENRNLLPAVALGLFAGIRTNEITRLDWKSIDLSEGIITIGVDIAKKRRLRVVELMPACKAWLSVCAQKEGRVAPAKFNRRWTNFVKAAGFDDWGENRVNAMRHSFGSYHYALYSDAAKTTAMLGHRSNDQVLFDSYRSLARKKDAVAYFAIRPK